MDITNFKDDYNCQQQNYLKVNRTIVNMNINSSAVNVRSIVNFNKELLGIQVYDISGRLVLENKKSSNIYDISNLKSGNYIINGVTTDNKNFSLKLIKK